DLEAGGGGVHRHREGDLQELVVLVPLDLGGEVDPPGAGAERHRLVDHRGAEGAAEPHDAPQAPGLLDLDLDRAGEGGAGQVGGVVAVVGVDVPGVPVAGPVVVELEHVAGGAGGDHLPVEVDVVDPGQPAIGVPLQAEAAVVDPAVAGGHRRDGRAGITVPGAGGGVDRRPPERRDVDELRPAGDVDDLP